jgi:hypothetical protein
MVKRRVAREPRASGQRANTCSAPPIADRKRLPGAVDESRRRSGRCSDPAWLALLSYNASSVPTLQLRPPSKRLPQTKLFDAGKNLIRLQLATVKRAAVASVGQRAWSGNPRASAGAPAFTRAK